MITLFWVIAYLTLYLKMISRGYSVITILINYRCVKIELKKKKPEEQQAKQSPDSVFILTVKLHEMHL